MNNKNGAFLCMFLLFLSCTYAHATTRYISPSGADGGAGATEATAWRSFAFAFSTMAAGDELVLLDGTYSVAAGTGYISYDCGTCGQPPSSTSVNNMTVVRAKNPGSVLVEGKLFLGRSNRKDSYIKIQGITFEGGGQFYNTSYNTIEDCGFHSTNLSGGFVFTVGTNDHDNGNTYNLIEDCWIWGQERGMALNYRGDYNLWRRVLVRGDGCNSASCTGSGNPNVGISVYESDHVSLQNVAVVDRILGGGEGYADFASAQHTGGSYLLGPNEWLGCISLNNEDAGYYLEADNANDSTHTLKNCVAWDNGAFNMNIGSQASNILLENITTGVNSAGSDNLRVAPAVGGGTVRNIIAYQAGRYGINSIVQPSYSDVFGATTSAYNQTSCATGCKTTNPLSDGTPASLKYLTRIETGSVLKATGYNGGDYGANILNAYGTDGARYGDAGYNTLSGNSLWPWPNEDRIKTELATSSARGFCAAGQDLSKYIWEYLGSPITLETPTGLGAVTLSSSSIILGWTDNSTLEDGFKIERKEGTLGTYVQIGTVGKDTFVYTDSGLNSSTLYYYRVRAYYSDRNSSYSNESFATTSASGSVPSSSSSDGGGGGGGGGGGCFIATAAFGSPYAQETKVLMRFRDRFLLHNWLGRQIVDIYYTISPAIAEYIQKREWARIAVRTILTPITRIMERYLTT